MMLIFGGVTPVVSGCNYRNTSIYPTVWGGNFGVMTFFLRIHHRGISPKFVADSPFHKSTKHFFVICCPPDATALLVVSAGLPNLCFAKQMLEMMQQQQQQKHLNTATIL